MFGRILVEDVRVVRYYHRYIALTLRTFLGPSVHWKALELIPTHERRNYTKSVLVGPLPPKAYIFTDSVLTELPLIELINHELTYAIHEICSSSNRLLTYASTDDCIDYNTRGPIIALIPWWSDEIGYVTRPSVKAPVFDAVR